MRIRSVFLILVTLFSTSAAEANTKNRKPVPDQSTARPQTVSAQAAAFEARVEDFLRQSGAEYHKVKTNSWYLLVPSKQMGQLRIILGAGMVSGSPGSIAMGAVVVPKRDLRLSTEALEKLMKLSYDLNYVRVCIDSDDDLIVMAQLKDPWLNAAEFRTTIDLVASAADRAYAVMRPYLNTR